MLPLGPKHIIKQLDSTLVLQLWSESLYDKLLKLLSHAALSGLISPVMFKD